MYKNGAARAQLTWYLNFKYTRSLFIVGNIERYIKLSDLAVKLCVLISETANNKHLICRYQKCLTIKGIQCGNCCHGVYTSEHMLMISSFFYH